LERLQMPGLKFISQQALRGTLLTWRFLLTGGRALRRAPRLLRLERLQMPGLKFISQQALRGNIV
jgi:hypothetical protein